MKPLDAWKQQLRQALLMPFALGTRDGCVERLIELGRSAPRDMQSAAELDAARARLTARLEELLTTGLRDDEHKAFAAQLTAIREATDNRYERAMLVARAALERAFIDSGLLSRADLE